MKEFKPAEPNPALYNLPFTTDRFNGMPYRRLGSSGLKVPAIGLGTWKIGYPETGDGARVDERTAFAMFDRAVELGAVFWDTANRYPNASGNSERVIGRWLKRNPDQRRNVVIATKMMGAMDGRTPNHCGLSRSNILDSVHASLGRLQTDYVDLLYFHGYDETAPIEESLAAVEDLVREGTVRYFAVSNFTAAQLAAYAEVGWDLSVRCRIAAVQNQYDLINGEQRERPGVLEYCAANGIAFIPWSPLAGGLISGRYLDPAQVGPGHRLYDEGAWKQGLSAETAAKLRKLNELAQESGMTASQLALAYMLTLPGMGPMIPAASNIGQLEANAAAGKVELTEAVRQRMAEIFGERTNQP
jgi:aryl-alcohol dehydrogenase-like predicted oxidoreductase